MNHALLSELQQLRADPSITLLLDTTPGEAMHADDRVRLHAMVGEAEERLARFPSDVRRTLVSALRRLVDDAGTGRSTRAVCICASPDHEAVIRLGKEVRSRVVIDETFATRDLVADANRTATFRVVTVSERVMRLMVGDRNRLVEVHDSQWPLVRTDEDHASGWRRKVNAALDRERRSFAVPTVFAGVEHSITDLVDEAAMQSIGVVPGNHDRTRPADLHPAASDLVDEWLRRDRTHALARLESARGARLFAGGIDEVWSLAEDGRVELLVVEDDYEYPARVGGPHLTPVSDDDVDMPGVVPDAVDELIEAVLRTGGDAMLVPPGELSDRDRLAAVLRY